MADEDDGAVIQNLVTYRFGGLPDDGVEGHMRRVISMFAEGRTCLDHAQQLHAVEKAIAEAKRQLIHDHVDHCLNVAVNGGSNSTRAVVSEFKAISPYL